MWNVCAFSSMDRMLLKMFSNLFSNNFLKELQHACVVAISQVKVLKDINKSWFFAIFILTANVECYGGEEMMPKYDFGQESQFHKQKSGRIQHSFYSNANIFRQIGWFCKIFAMLNRTIALSSDWMVSTVNTECQTKEFFARHGHLILRGIDSQIVMFVHVHIKLRWQDHFIWFL